MNYTKTSNTMVLFAKGPSASQALPWLTRNPLTDRWIVNQSWRMPPYREYEDKRFTTVLEIHGYQEMVVQGSGKGVCSGPDYNLYWLRTQPLHECPFPVFVQEPRPEWPTSIKFPFKEINDTFKSAYHTSTIDYAICLAMLYKYEHIVLAGVDLGSQWEIQQDMPCIQWWCGRALERGIRISVTDRSNLFIRGPLADKSYARYSYPYMTEQCIERIV